jgi:hypothetical protein
MKQSAHNPYISWLKGVAILAIVYIHLVDWSNIILSLGGQAFKEVMYLALFLFVALAGSLAYVSQAKYVDVGEYARRAISRGLQLWAVYFGYSVLKLYIYNFNQQPFYQQFIDRGIFDIRHILSLEVYSSPMSILLTIGAFLIISPLIVWMTRRLPKPSWWILGLTGLTLWINYGINLPTNALTNFLYARDNITFPVLLWLPIFLIGYWLAMIGIEKYRVIMLAIFGGWSAYLIGLAITHHQSWFPRDYLYPIQPYYIVVSLGAAYLLVSMLNLMRRVHWRLVQAILKGLEVLGSNTLFLYIGYLVVLDLTLWLAYPQVKWVWFTIPMFLGLTAWYRTISPRVSRR